MLQKWNEGVESTDEWLSSAYGMQKLAGNAMMIEVIGEEVKKVEKRLGTSTPKKNLPTDKPISKEEFSKMKLTEQAALYQTNPELYKQLQS